MTYETGITVQEKVGSLFQPDVLLPAQYFETLRRKTLEPEEKLMLAVLEDGVACFLKYLRAENRTGKTLFRDAEEWIWAENSDWLFSFENICEALGLSPTYVRRGLLRWMERKPFYYHKVSAIESLSPRGKVPRTGNGRIETYMGMQEARQEARATQLT